MHFRTVVSLILVASLADLGVIPRAAAAREGRAKKQEVSFRQQVEWYGVGAEIRVWLRGSRETRGRIESITDRMLELRPAGVDMVQRISYEEIRRIEYAKTSYRAGGRADPLEARRVALGLGNGHAVRVRTEDGRTFRGQIAAVEAEKLTLKVHGGLEDLPYPQIHQLKGRMTGKEIGLLVGLAWVGVGVVVAILSAAGWGR